MSSVPRKLAPLSPERRKLLGRLLKEEQIKVKPQDTIPRRSATAALLPSFAQERLWFLHQMLPESALYNLPLLLHITGRLDAHILQRAFNEIIRRHEALRTTFY